MTSTTELENGVADVAVDEDECIGAGGYRFDSEEEKEAIKLQRAALWQWLKSVGSNIFRDGINLTKISLPVGLFEARSFLERLTSNWEFQGLLTAAADCTDPVDRMKYVVCFALGGLCRQVSANKPFNPILGETFQARFDNGVEVYVEQISHHPPVSSWQVVEPSGKFDFHGNGNWSASARGNCIKGRQSGINCITFADGSDVTYELPGLSLKGILWGERVIKYQGNVEFVDKKNNLVCEVEIDPAVPQTWGSWLRGKKSAQKPDQVKAVLRRGDMVLDTCTGTWMSYLEWEKGVGPNKVKRIWDRQATPVTVAKAVEADALASDCRLREDLIALQKGEHDKAQEWKTKLEDMQRNDRKLRKEGGGYEH